MGTPRSEIHKSGPDNSVEFGQEALAEDIADQISRDHNTHVAVNGPWGSGKTTVLKHAEEQIENENSEVITHWYEPWRYGPDQTTLRRTFLKTLDEKVASELNNEPLLKTERYYFQNVEFEPKNIGEYARDFWRTLQAHSYFIVGFTLIVTFLFAAGSWAVATASSGIGFVIGNALSATALFLFSILIVYMRSDLASELAAQATFDVKEPKISEIDLFEDQYEKLLDRAGKENKRIVVFIDDVDRCDSEEIREVITGLSTYLNPDHDNADVAFVAAIDGPKILESFEPEKKSNGLRTNILNKTFQVILPVPSVSRDNVIKLVEKTTEDLDYTVSDDDIERISSISVTHANSNLRIIRSALCEVQWMSDLGADYLEDFGYEESKSFQRILNSDFNLYRIALIKLLSDDEDLRRSLFGSRLLVG